MPAAKGSARTPLGPKYLAVPFIPPRSHSLPNCHHHLHVVGLLVHYRTGHDTTELWDAVGVEQDETECGENLSAVDMVAETEESRLHVFFHGIILVIINFGNMITQFASYSWNEHVLMVHVITQVRILAT